MSQRVGSDMRIDGRESGAAMLIVMLVLLVVTATATLAMTSSQFEIRAAGHQRQAMQTTAIAQAGLVATTTRIEMEGGARVLQYRMEQAPLAPTTRLSPEEPPVGSGEANRSVRFLSTDMVVGLSPLVRAGATADLDPMSAFEPRYIVDITDGYEVLPTFVGQAQGTRVDGEGTVDLRYFVSTVTSRGRMVRRGLLDANGGYGASAVFTPPEAGRAGHLRRDIFETSATARAVTISGPYSPM